MNNLTKREMFRKSPKSRYSPKTFVIFWLFQLVLVVSARLAVDDDLNYMSIMSAWTGLCFIGILFHHSYLIGDKNWMAMPIVFYIPYWLVFFLIPLLLILQEGFVPRNEHIIASQYWCLAVFTASIGISCFLGGYSLIARRRRQHSYRFEKLLGFREVRVIRISAWILLLIALAALGVLMGSGGTGLYKGGYVHVGHLGWGVRVAFIAFDTAFRGAIGLWAIYLLLCTRPRLRHLVPIGCLGIMLLAMVLSGDRGLLGFFGVGVLVIYSQRRPARLRHMVCGLLVGSVAFAAIQAVRPTGERSITAYISAITEDFNPLRGLTQFGVSTAYTVTNAFAAVEENGHFHGTFFGQGILSIIPFYGKLFPWLPAAQDRSMDGTGAYITNYVFGYHAYGLGTTVVTDIYIDFGLIGVSVIMFFYGCFGGYLYNCRYRGKYHFGLLCYALFVPAFMYSTRAAVTSSFRLFWTIALCYFVFIMVDDLVRTIGNRKT